MTSHCDKLTDVCRCEKDGFLLLIIFLHQKCANVMCRFFIEIYIGLQYSNKKCRVEFPTFVTLNKTHHTRYVAHCKKVDIFSFPMMCYMSWFGPMTLVVVRIIEVFCNKLSKNERIGHQGLIIIFSILIILIVLILLCCINLKFTSLSCCIKCLFQLLNLFEIEVLHCCSGFLLLK